MADNKNIRMLNIKLAALTLGTVAAMLIFSITVITLAIEVETGVRYLMLWTVFLPGYDVSFTGALIGALWGLIWGGIAGGLIYSIYDAEWHLEESRAPDDVDRTLSPPFVSIDGNALGLGLGAVTGLALFVATAWLVVRGTADQSPHAALLAWYLPGYSVSISGALIGAFGIGVAVYLFSRIGAFTYNSVLRHRRLPVV